MLNEDGGVVIELRPRKTMASLASVPNESNGPQDCSDAQGAGVQCPHGEVNGVRWSKAADVLLIDGVVVGQLKQIPWLAGYGWRLSSVVRGSIEAPSLPGLVRAWLGRRLCEGVRP